MGLPDACDEEGKQSGGGDGVPRIEVAVEEVREEAEKTDDA
jgi:hypothetical protein